MSKDEKTFAEYLRAQRTMTQAEVDAAAHATDRTYTPHDRHAPSAH